MTNAIHTMRLTPRIDDESVKNASVVRFFIPFGPIQIRCTVTMTDEAPCAEVRIAFVKNVAMGG